MVDGSVGLKSLETILAVKEQYRDLIDIQLVAFPQSGILKSPGTPELLDEAIGMGADLIGGLDPASFDRDVTAHLDVVFAIAEKRGVDADIHLHEGGSMGALRSRRFVLALKHSVCRGMWQSAMPTVWGSASRCSAKDCREDCQKWYFHHDKCTWPPQLPAGGAAA